MIRPNRAYLCGAKWKILYRTYTLISGDEKCGGMCTDTTRTIQVEVAEDMCEDHLRQTVLHELMHACVFSVGGEWPESEETAVRLLERPLLTLFTDSRNSRLVSWLRGEDE